MVAEQSRHSEFRRRAKRSSLRGISADAATGDRGRSKGWRRMTPAITGSSVSPKRKAAIRRSLSLGKPVSCASANFRKLIFSGPT